ncbi:hypothetical protein CPB97_006223, partial [Podila verticillata]
MKINSCLFIAIATAVALISSFTDAKRDRRDVAAAAVAENVDDPTEIWKHKHHHHRGQHGHHQGQHEHRRDQHEHHQGQHEHHQGQHDHHQGQHDHHDHHGKHHRKKCKTQTVVVFAPCTYAGDPPNFEEWTNAPVIRDEVRATTNALAFRGD